MSNMSYCRFENTVGDVKDCTSAVRRQETLSEWELPKAKEMLQACKDFVEEATRLGFMDEDNNIHFTSEDS